jgi:hypothetical protein
MGACCLPQNATLHDERATKAEQDQDLLDIVMGEWVGLLCDCGRLQ